MRFSRVDLQDILDFTIKYAGYNYAEICFVGGSDYCIKVAHRGINISLTNRLHCQLSIGDIGDDKLIFDDSLPYNITNYSKLFKFATDEVVYHFSQL